MQLHTRRLRAGISVAALAACAGGALAAPPNDLCANAITLPANGSLVSGTNVAATTDAPGTGACASNSIDVWYKYTHPAASAQQGLTLTTCTGTSFDSVLRVFTGTCGSLTQVGCNDDSCGLQSTVSITVNPGVTYYIMVAGFSGATGTFQISGTLTDPPPPPTPGPDVIVGDVSDGSAYGNVGTIYAYSLGTTSCNIGDTNVQWVANNNQHPVIGQNIYRIENNRMELIGNSWLKHGFTALTQNLCSTCSGQGGAVLGVGCSDPYVSSLNGDQSRLGPRSHVNATTGFYPYPFTSPPSPYVVPPAAPATIGRRIQIQQSEMGHAGATYVGECQYTTADDANYVGSGGTAHNSLNNVSYRLVTLSTGALTMNNVTVRMLPALKAWQAIDPTVVVNSYDYQEGVNTARYWVAAKVVNNNNGTWTYNYTVFNLNSDRSMASFSVPAANVTTSNFFQRTPVYHSGEPTSMNNAWTRTASTSVTWATPDTYSSGSPWGSALRWSTAATFGFTANTAPMTGACGMTFFKPGAAANLSFGNLPVPTPGTPPCAADFNNDGTLDFFDYLDFVDAFSSNLPSADFNQDGVIDFFDYLDFVDAFSIGC